MVVSQERVPCFRCFGDKLDNESTADENRVLVPYATLMSEQGRDSVFCTLLVEAKRAQSPGPVCFKSRFKQQQYITCGGLFQVLKHSKGASCTLLSLCALDLLKILTKFLLSTPIKLVCHRIASHAP